LTKARWGKRTKFSIEGFAFGADRREGLCRASRERARVTDWARKAWRCIPNTNVVFAGPPIADQKEVVRVGRLGENLRLVCPVSGYPQIMVEWYKDGEKIDFTWERHNAGNTKCS